jgi:hypothetical protein
MKKIIKLTAERELKKETPAREPSRDQREPSKDQREPTPREKSVKEVKVKEEKRDRETKERDDVDHSRKREKEKERRREKRPSSPPADQFEGDLSSVSNSSSGSMPPTADLVIVDDQRGEICQETVTANIKTDFSLNLFFTETKRRKVEVATKVSITV